MRYIHRIVQDYGPYVGAILTHIHYSPGQNNTINIYDMETYTVSADGVVMQQEFLLPETKKKYLQLYFTPELIKQITN